jgi:zinc finger MYND domain-containing protein 10
MNLNIIQPEEIEIFVQSLKCFDVSEIGSKLWLEHHERIIKLNQQAIVEASGCREEIVKEFLIIQGKLEILVHEVYCILVWRTKILPKLLGCENISGSFFIYTILFHESTVVSLMETILYHENACEALGDFVIDLMDYCVHGITQLIGLCHAGFHQQKNDPKIEKSTKDEIKLHRDEISFIIGMKCLTILSYLCDKISTLSTSAARRMTQTHDVPCLLSEILSIRPWLRRIKHFEKFIDGKWKFVEGEEILKLTKVEAQTWFCLRSIIFHRETFQIYEINSFRQRELGKCAGLLNETVLDQIPPLAELKQFLCTLQINNDVPNHLSSLTLEVVPEVSELRIYLFNIKSLKSHFLTSHPSLMSRSKTTSLRKPTKLDGKISSNNISECLLK